MNMRAGTKEPDPAAAVIERALQGAVDRPSVATHLVTVWS